MSPIPPSWRRRPCRRCIAITALPLQLLLQAVSCGTPTDAVRDIPADSKLAEITSAAETVTLAQLDITLDDGAHPNSPWGQALVAYSGSPNVLYANLAVDGVWRIQNVPVLSREGSGVAQSAALLFDLGVRDGTDITSAQVSFELSTFILTRMPRVAASMSVGNLTWAISTGISRGAISYAPPSPSLIGAQAAGAKVTHTGFPNQQANNNECVPVALSNSLQWLNAKYGLGLAAADISVDAMKAVVGWQATGAGPQWWTKKRTRFKDVLTTATIPRFNISEVYDAIARGCDVELSANDHVVAVTGAQQLADGKYTLDLTHDPNQKDGKPPGAEGTQTVTWDPKTKKFTGAPFIEGRAAELIVVECPKQGR